MKLLVVLALAQATLGSPLYTPEVASAKAAHLVAHSLAISGATALPVSYKTLAPAPVITASGFLADAPEVAAAKAAHFAEHARAGDYSWASQVNNPYKAAQITSGGYLADTPVVAIAQYSRQPGAAPIPYSGLIPDSPELAVAKAVYFAEHAKATRLPAHLPTSGLIPDSPEVALAKAAHYNEHVKASVLANAIIDNYHLVSPISTPLGLIPKSPEVIAARAAHLAAKSASIAAAQHPI